MMFDIKIMRIIIIMTKMKIKYYLAYIGVNIVLIIISYFMGGLWLINTQVGFICSMIIVIASFFSYRSMIEKRLQNGDIPQERDERDKIDDKYQVFNEKKILNNREFMALDKKNRKKASGIKLFFTSLFKSKSAIFGPLRIMAYLLFISSIYFLVNNDIFSMLPFLVGVSMVPVSSILSGIITENFGFKKLNTSNLDV